MIVVSDIEFADLDHIQRVPPKEFINSSMTDSFIVNISHDYCYMKMGYYVSVQAELLGDEVYPKSEDTIDVYRPPILLIRAMKAGIKVVPNILTGSVKDVLAEFSLPVLLFPVKPSQTYENTIVKTKGALYNEMKKMTMNGGYVTVYNLYSVNYLPSKPFLVSLQQNPVTKLPMKVSANYLIKFMKNSKFHYSSF